MTREPFLGLPRGADARAALVLAAALGAVFVVLYGGASYLSGLVPYRVRIDLPVEARVPFVPAAAVVYLSITPLLGLAPFVLRRFDELFPLVAALAVQTLVAAVCFVALPVEPGYPPRVASGPAAELFALADALNLERNAFPSLHVAYATSAILAYSAKSRGATTVALWLWLAAVVASTVLIHEHHLADVAGGAVLGAASLPAVARRCVRARDRCLRAPARSDPGPSGRAVSTAPDRGC